MITLHPISAGSGIDYLMSTVAGDDVKVGTKGLTEYWSGGGDTPGEWLGAQAAAMGLTGQVSQEAADAIFKDAVDPRTGEPLGRAWSRFTPADELYEKWLAAEPDATDERATQLRGKADREGNKTARAGWEMVFSPVKSFSILWGMADDPTRARLEAVERAAFEKVFARIESEACRTRVGPTPAAQVEVEAEGLIAAAFTHRSSRSGDPDFHRHLAISAKVRTADGRWLALWTPRLHRMTVELSELYTAEVERGMAADFDITAAARQNTIRPDKRAVREFRGVDQDTVRHFSERRRTTEQALTRFTRDFIAREGREPTRAEAYELAQAAALTARPDKQPTTVDGERRAWRDRARQVGIERPDDWVGQAQQASLQAAQSPDEPVGLHRVADQVLAVLESGRSTWTRSNVQAETYRQLTATGWHLRTGDAFDDVVRRVVDQVLAPDHCAPVTAPDTVPVPDRFRRPDGSSIFTPTDTHLWVSHRIRRAEEHLVDGATRPGALRTLTRDQVDAALAHGANRRDFTPSEEQHQVVRSVFTGDCHLSAIIGPAGTGKTTIMQLVREVADAHGIDILGLAGGQVQADNLAEEAGIRTENIARWRAMSERAAVGQPQWSLRPGCLVIVDEAGQASTPDLHALAIQVENAGGRLLLVGDPRQLGTPGVGGALALIEADAGAQYLTEVRRFRDPGGTIRTWEVDAATQIAEGNPNSYDAYATRRRIHSGGATTMKDTLYTAWKRDIDDGMTAVMIASSNALVTELNARAREDRVAQGAVDDTAAVDLADGNRVGPGDRIVTRKIDRLLTTHDGRQWVRNGDTWTVRAIEPGGEITARHDRTRRLITLPADYVDAAVELGYAITKDRAQGLTVDVGHALFDSGLDRNAAYPSLTRGRWANYAYLITTSDPDPETGEPGPQRTARQVWADILRRDGSQQSATATQRQVAAQARSVRTQLGRLTFVLDQLAAEQAGTAVAAALGQPAADQLAAAPAWPALRAQLVRLAHDGIDTDRLLHTAWHQQGFLDTDGSPVRDIAAIIHARNTRILDGNQAGHYQLGDGAPRPRTAPSFIGEAQVRADDVVAATGLLLPEPADGDDQVTYAHALATAARSHAAGLARTARLDANARDGWAEAFGPQPATADAAAWSGRLAAAAAYRDLAEWTGPDPTGPAPGTIPGQAELRGLWRAAQPLPDPVQEAADLAATGPTWLDALGPRPPADTPGHQTWNRAAVAISTYRRLWEYGHETIALGERPTEPVAAADYDAAHTALTTWRQGAAPPEDTRRLDDEQLRIHTGRGHAAAEQARRAADALAAWHSARRESAAARQIAEDTANRAHAARCAATTDEQHIRAEALDQAADAARRAATDAGDRERAARATWDTAAPDALAAREQARHGQVAARERARRTLHGDQDTPAADGPPRPLPPWDQRPHGRLTDADLQHTNTRALDAARAADRQAALEEVRATQLAAHAAPGGLVDQRVTALATRIDAIAEVRTLDAHLQRARAEASRLETTRRRLDEQLDAGGRAMRGAQRRALEEQRHQLADQAAHHAERTAEFAQRREQASVTAGNPDEHEQLLRDWQQAGGSHTAALARARTAAVQDASAAETEAEAMRGHANQLRDTAAAVRREVGIRAAMDHERRTAENTQRQQTAARTARQTPHQPSSQQSGPRRSGPQR